MNIKNNYVLELFRECNKDENFIQYSENVNMGFQMIGDTLLILFEPSEGKVDWCHNFTFFKKPYHDMEISYYVHGGFLKCWRIVKDVFRAKLHERTWTQIVITGYSHGGALAQLAHECAWFELPDLRDGRILTIAFEAPRIYAGRAVKEELRERWKNCYVVRNNEDIVTHMPPKWLGFCDVGEMICIQNREPQGGIDSHKPVWVERALLAAKNKNALAIAEAKLKAAEIWEQDTRA